VGEGSRGRGGSGWACESTEPSRRGVFSFLENGTTLHSENAGKEGNLLCPESRDGRDREYRERRWGLEGHAGSVDFLAGRYLVDQGAALARGKLKTQTGTQCSSNPFNPSFTLTSSSFSRSLSLVFKADMVIGSTGPWNANALS